jgi:hypothetical protein
MKILGFIFSLLVCTITFAQNLPETKVRLKPSSLVSATYGSEDQIWINNNYTFGIQMASQNGTQRLEYADVIVSWDPTKFEYVSSQPSNDARISQTTPTLSPASVANGVNDTFTDGNAMFRIQRNPNWGGQGTTPPAYQLTAITGTDIPTYFNGLNKITLRCISEFIGQSSQISILPSIQIPGYPTAFTKVWGCDPVVDVTGALMNRTVVGHTSPASKLDLAFESPDAPVVVGNFISIPLKIQPQNNPQRFIVADIAFTWNPAHLRLVGMDFIGNNNGVWDNASGFPGPNNTPESVCCDLFGTNEVIPPQDGTGLIYIYGFLGGNFIAFNPEILCNLNFEVVGSFASTQVTTVPQLQSPNGVQETVVYGSSVPGLEVTGNHYAATVVGGARLGDFNNDNVVNSADMATMLSNWGQISYGNNPCDLNNNGVVDAPDLAILVGNWG